MLAFPVIANINVALKCSHEERRFDPKPDSVMRGWESSCGSILQQAALKDLLPAQRSVKRKYGQRHQSEERRHPYPGVPRREVESDRESDKRIGGKRCARKRHQAIAHHGHSKQPNFKTNHNRTLPIPYIRHRDYEEHEETHSQP